MSPCLTIQAKGALPCATDLRTTLGRLQGAHSTPASLGGRSASELQQLQGQARHSEYSQAMLVQQLQGQARHSKYSHSKYSHGRSGDA
eukprot:scaffold109698_cov60-Phaeocystis_antarctica.AAC.1